MNKYEQLLQIYKHPFTLTRFGKNCDGGYIVPKELVNDNLLSCGISNEISFEIDYLKNISNPNIHCFDGTITNFPSNDLYFNWHKINLGANDTENEVSLNTIFNKCFKNKNDIFIKMDIEASEYPAFSSISENNLNKISCLIIEVHWIDTMFEQFEQLMNLLNNKLVLIHKHDNNLGGYFNNENIQLGRVYELTFVNNKYIDNKNVNDIKLPIEGLDFNNGEL